MASSDELLEQWCHRAARTFSRAFPWRRVEVMKAPDGLPSVRVDLDYFRPAEDGETLLGSHYDGDCVHVVRLDWDWQELEAWTVRIGADPGMN